MEINLTGYRVNHYSQNGEAGVIAKLLELFRIKLGWLVEFGAWDGKYLSNTRHVAELNQAFNSMLIESDPEKFAQIELLKPNSDVKINAAVQVSGTNSLNSIFERYFVHDIAVLSIDVDGEDLKIWNSLDKTKYRPAIVCIESQWQYRRDVEYLDICFEKAGYVIACVTGNFIFVRNDLIKSGGDIHKLLSVSGSIDYDLHHKNIDQEEYKRRAELMSTDKELFKRLAGPQIIKI